MNMEETNKSPNDHGENKKMVIKLGGGGGGSGIGAVVLLGGALATAALASVFAVRQKRRSSGEDSHNSSPEINNKNEDGEADISEGGKEDVELKLDDKAMVETDGTISDDGFVIKKEIPLLAENLTTEDEEEKVEFTKEDVSDDYLHDDQIEADKNVDVEKKGLEGFCNEQDNVDGDDEEGSLPTDDAEMVQVDEAIVEEDEKCYVSDAGIVPKQNRLVDDMGEVGESKTSMQFDAEKNVKEMEEEVIPVEVARDGDNGEDPQKVGPDGNWTLFSHPDDRKDDVEKEDEKGELMREKRLEQFFSDGSRGKDLNDEAALSNGSCSESNWEALWQAEMPQQVKIMKYEVGGKIQEDILNSESYAMELRRIKGYPTNYSMRWRVIIWTVSVLSSLSCSWFFDLSIAKVSLVVFLTAFLLEIYGYSLLNRQHAQCLLAAEEDHAYDHKMPSKKLAKI
ncbi:hypothetical protein C2S51_008721 [Perilla frutescens var. frutescens]|nr:hypothetical protein C2S51_008721 [Perilla frutescens var. frutescens]